MSYPKKNYSTLPLLHKIFSIPDLPQKIQTLPAPILKRWILEIGLEDSAEILALASSQQLTNLLDEDLWQQSAPGEQETFDREQLALWFEVLQEMGSRKAASKLVEMDEDFLAFAFSQYTLVIDLDAIALSLANTSETDWKAKHLEKALESYLYYEVDAFRVIAKPGAPWDAIINILNSLEELDWDLTLRLLQRLCDVSTSAAEDAGGLYELLSDEDQLENDINFSREVRRTQQGYVAATDALAFLGWIKATPDKDILEKENPTARAYFREYKGTPLLQKNSSSDWEESIPLLKDNATPIAVRKTHEPNTPTKSPQKISPFLKKIQSLSETDPEGYAQALLELNFLTQTISVGEKREEKWRLQEAAAEVIQLCELGMKLSPQNNKLTVLQLFSLGYKNKTLR